MILTPSAFTYEHLTTLKFKELQKLSVQFHVNKRWAKKQELIENLLALKEQDEKKITNKQKEEEEEKEWRDGSTVFNDLQLNNENNMDRRLTFSVSKKYNTGNTDSVFSFGEVPHNGENFLRETYDIPPNKTDFSVKPLLDSRATFEIPPKELLKNIDSRATFEISQNGRILLEENKVNLNLNLYNQNSDDEICKNNFDMDLKKINNLDFKQDLGKTRFDPNIKSGKEGKGVKIKPQMNILKTPCTRVTRRTKLNETTVTDKSPIKISKMSINIKKSTRIPVGKCDLLKSPAFSSVKKSINKQTIIKSLTKMQPGKIVQSKVPVRLKFTEKSKLTDKLDSNNKENMKKILRKRISRTADEVHKKNSNLVKVNFRTPPPPPSLTKSSKALPLKKTPLKKDMDEKLNSNAAQTSGNKLAIRPIVTTKMPDFNKIHKRQFEQMDSLQDYLKKKEERIKKLFGTPQPGQQLQALSKSTPVFRFQSLAIEKENNESKALKSKATPLKAKEKDAKTAQKETFKNKLPPSKLRTDLKDKNRSHIHGVRTNKRFELQMKFRNI